METAKRTRPVVTGPALSFEERLSLAAKGLDIVMEHKHGNDLSAVQKAVEAARAYVPPSPVGEPNPVLSAARKLILERGWVQHEYTNPSGAVCAQQAIKIAGAVSGSAYWSRASAEAMDVLYARIFEETGQDMTVSRWNDTRENRDDVLRLLW